MAKQLAHFRARLKDPASAQFRNVVLYREGERYYVCGWVNAKNGFGGYTGHKFFLAADGATLMEGNGIDPEVRDLRCQ